MTPARHALILRCKAANAEQLASCYLDEARGYDHDLGQIYRVFDIEDEPLPDDWMRLAEIDLPKMPVATCGVCSGVISDSPDSACLVCKGSGLVEVANV